MGPGTGTNLEAFRHRVSLSLEASRAHPPTLSIGSYEACGSLPGGGGNLTPMDCPCAPVLCFVPHVLPVTQFLPCSDRAHLIQVGLICYPSFSSVLRVVCPVFPCPVLNVNVEMVKFFVSVLLRSNTVATVTHVV